MQSGFWKAIIKKKNSGAYRRTTHTILVKLRKGVEAAGGRIIENDRYVSRDYIEESEYDD